MLKIEGIKIWRKSKNKEKNGLKIVFPVKRYYFLLRSAAKRSKEKEQKSKTHYNTECGVTKPASFN
jgi:hypothetical protein